MAEENKTPKPEEQAELFRKVTEYITKGGRPEYQESTTPPRTYTVYNQPFAKANGDAYGTFEYYKAKDGSYTRDLSKVTDISFDSKTGNITVSVPDRIADDEYVKSYVNNDFLKQLSSNYKTDNSVRYQDPYDENKKYTTEEYIAKINEALQDRAAALHEAEIQKENFIKAVSSTKGNLIRYFGDDEEKKKFINSLGTDQIVLMSATGVGDSKYLATPKWLLEAYPEVKDLPSYNNGFVLGEELYNNLLVNSDDFNLDKSEEVANRFLSWYYTSDIYNNPENFEAFYDTPEKEQLDEFARNIAFSQYLSKAVPNVGAVKGTMLHADAWSSGWWYGLTTGFEKLLNNVAAIMSGGTVETASEFFDSDPDNYVYTPSSESPSGEWTWTHKVDPAHPASFIDLFFSTLPVVAGFDEETIVKKRVQEQLLTGETFGSDFGIGLGTVLETIAEITSTYALMNSLTSELTAYSAASGASATADEMAKVATETAETSKTVEIATEAQNLAYKEATAAELLNSTSKVATLGNKAKSFFSLTVPEATRLFTETYGGTAAALSSMNAAQAASILNTAVKSAKATAGVSTALGVISDLLVWSAVADKETLNKIITNKATTSETKAYITKVLLYTVESQGLGLVSNKLAGTKAGEAISASIDKVNNWASGKVSGMTAKITSPWLKFREWFLRHKIEKAAAHNTTASNATLQSYEAVKEGELRNTAREYLTNLQKTISKYEKAGVGSTVVAGKNVIIDPATGEELSIQDAKATVVALENSLTNRNDVDAIYSSLLNSISNPDIEPAMSAQNKEVADADTSILKEEMSLGLLDKNTIKSNKQWKNEPYRYVFSLHSQVVSDYAFLAYSVQHEMDVCIAEKIPFEDSPALKEAQEQLAAAAEKVPISIQSMVNNQLLPSLYKLTHSIMDRMIYDWKVYPRELVEGLRKEGKWGKDGEHYIRLVSREEPKTGVFESFDGTTKRVNNIDLTRAGRLDVNKSTWIGYGPFELLQESALAISARDFRNASVKVSGLTPEILMSGQKTAGARKMKEYRLGLNNAIKQGLDSFVKDVEGTVAIGPKKIVEAEEYVKEATQIGGVNSMDIDELRSLMEEKGSLTTESIVDQNSLDALYINSSPDGQKLITDTLGRSITPFEITGGTIPNNSFFSTVAPYKFNPVDSSNYLERLGEISNTFNSVASKIADDIGIKVSNVRNNVGGYTFNDGNHVNEVSFTYNFPKGTSREDSELFGCLLGDLGYEPQEAVIVGRYLNKASKADGYIIEYSIDTDAVPSVIDAIEKAGIESYTVDMVNGKIQVLAFPDDITKMVSDKDRNRIVGQLKKINSIMKGKAHAIQRKAVDSRLIEKSDRASLYRKWLDSHGEQRGGRLYNDVERALEAVTKAEKTGKAVADKNFLDSLGSSQYTNLVGLKEGMPDAYNSFLDKLDRINALGNPEVANSPQVAKKGEEFMADSKIMENDTIFKEKFSYVAKTKGSKGSVKYDIDEDILYQDIDDAIDGLLGYVRQNNEGYLAVKGMAEYQDYKMSEVYFQYQILNELLNPSSTNLFKETITNIAERVVDSLIPDGQTVKKGELKSLTNKVKTAITDKFELRLSKTKTLLESSGYKIDSTTITDLIDKYNTEIVGYKADTSVIKTTDSNGEIQFEKVSPLVAELYNSRPVYKPMSTPAQMLANAALMKRISLTNLNPRSFAKQAVSDPLMAYVTIGALPGTGILMDADMRAIFGDNFANQLKANDPFRYENIMAIAKRDGITFADAALKEFRARTNIQLPFTTMSREALTQANVNKYGTEEAMKRRFKHINQEINKGLRKVSEVLGKPNDLREEYVRKVAGEKAYLKALNKGYSIEQAEQFKQHAIDNATTNFRQKHTMFNNLRSSTPYLTSGISGAKSFWKMFELDPVGVTARILNGLVFPIVYFMGEIVSDDDTRKKYKNLSFSEKNDHIAITVNGEIILIPVGEELGTIVNPINHTIEELYGVSKYDFWQVMLNDAVGLSPVDLTGFTDPEMWNDVVNGPPSFLNVMENGVSKMLAQTMPPVAQSVVMATTGRDLYTGNKINTGYVSVDDDGNAYIQSYSQSQFAMALANIVGGDARVIEKVTSGMFGTTALNLLDTLVSAVQYVTPGGEEGDLLTGAKRALSDLKKPFATNGYDDIDKQWQYSVNDLYALKRQIEDDEFYKKYNEQIAREKDPTRRQKLKNNRDDLLVEYKKKVNNLVTWYRDSGGSLSNKKFSTAVSLLVFEDAVRADRQFMDLNTNYSDAYKQAMQTLDKMGVSNPDGPSMLGYVYTDNEGRTQVKMWTPAQVQVIYDAYYNNQGDIHKSRIEAIIDDRTENSLKNQRKAETKAEQKYWDKYNSTGKLSDSEWDAIDDLRKAYNTKVVLALQDYMDAYGAANILSNDEVMNYLVDEVIKVPSSEEKVNNRFVSSGGGVLNKQEGFGPYYIKKIFGVAK